MTQDVPPISWACCKNVTPSLNEASDLLDALRTFKRLGANGDSNGCVSSNNCDAFPQAYLNHEIKQLAVVTPWNDDLRHTWRDCNA